MQTVERAVSEALTLTAADTEKPDIFLIAKRHGFFTGETLLTDRTDAFLVSNTGAGIRYMAFEAHPKSKVIFTRQSLESSRKKYLTAYLFGLYLLAEDKENFFCDYKHDTADDPKGALAAELLLFPDKTLLSSLEETKQKLGIIDLASREAQYRLAEHYSEQLGVPSILALRKLDRLFES